MFYEIDLGKGKGRFFSREVWYSEIDWSNLHQVIDAYRRRIHDWYIEPAKELAENVHYAFSVMALNCLLIDTISQFEAGIDYSKPCVFKDFIRKRMPTYSRKLEVAVQHYDGSRKEPISLEDVADVLYHGFRCGILHQAHIPPYGGVIPKAADAVSEASGLVKYKESKTDCPSVTLDPLRLLEELCEVFEAYLLELKDRDPKNGKLRENFKKKFSNSFGIDISTAA